MIKSHLGKMTVSGLFLALTVSLLVSLLVSFMAVITSSPAEASPSTPTITPKKIAYAGAYCASGSRGPFAPTNISIQGVGDNISVTRVGVLRNGSPATAPISSWGKNVVAWARYYTWPGDSSGNVLMNAHTWPDGTAIGNRLLGGLQPGARIVVTAPGGKHLCYQVTRRAVYSPYGRSIRQYYNQNGAPQLAIVSCSGKRLGPGVWTKRTVWYATPVRY